MAKRKPISIKDVARESKASLTTVSLVLNNRDSRISPATRKRVLATVNRLGYRPSYLARGLQAQKSGFLAILVPQLRHAFADAYFGELISAIQESAAKAGHKIIIEVANKEYVESEQHLELFRRRVVDGVLCMGATSLDTYIEDLADGEHAMVIVNNYLRTKELNHVKCDYEQAGRLAGQHLIELGHREIGLIHGASEVQTTYDLRRGFESALAAAGITLPPERVEDGLYTEEGGDDAVVHIMDRDPDVTAILAGNDKMAIGAISGLKGCGLTVPGDVSVVGCDDMHQAEFCDPPLTTIHTPIYEVGRRACEKLLHLAAGEVESIEETYPVHLTVRKSTCTPRKTR